MCWYRSRKGKSWRDKWIELYLNTMWRVLLFTNGRNRVGDLSMTATLQYVVCQANHGWDKMRKCMCRFIGSLSWTLPAATESYTNWIKLLYQLGNLECFSLRLESELFHQSGSGLLPYIFLHRLCQESSIKLDRVYGKFPTTVIHPLELEHFEGPN